MDIWLGRWLKTKISHLVEDFASTNFSCDLRKGTIELSNISIAAGALQTMTENILNVIPVVVTALTIGMVRIQVDSMGSGTETICITVDTVDFHLHTQCASEWDVTKLSKSYRTAKAKALELHSGFVRFGRREGDGFVHGMRSMLLDRTAICASNLACSLTDRFSLQTDKAGHPFALGAGLAKAEMKRRQGMCEGDAVFRTVLLCEPSVYVDLGEAAVEGLDEPVPSEMHGSTERSDNDAHDWILRPSAQNRFELGLLQCWRPAYISVEGRVAEGGSLIHEYGFAKLACPLHDDSDKDSAFTMSAANLPLPKSGAVVSMDKLQLDLTRRHIEVLLSFVAFAVVGYGAVLQGVQCDGIQCNSSPALGEEFERYGHDWLKSAILIDADGALRKQLTDFEQKYPLEVVMKARQDVLDSISIKASLSRSLESTRCSYIEAAWAKARNVGRRWFTLQMIQMLDAAADDEDNWEKMAELIREMFTLRDPRWQESYRALFTMGVVAHLAGMHCFRLQVNIILEDMLEWHRSLPPGVDGAAAQRSGMRPLGGTKYLSFTMDEIVFSTTKHHDGSSFAQVALFDFHVEDHYGPRMLQALASRAMRALQVPTRQSLVRPGGASTIADLDADCSGSLHRSELYFAIGRWKLRSGSEAPDSTLLVKSFGDLHVCLPPSQILTLCLMLFPAGMRYHLGLCFMGVPWRSTASASVVDLACRNRKAPTVFSRTSADGQNENWLLDICVEPIHVFVPVPRPLTKLETISIGSACARWGDTFDLCLGKVSALSRLQPRQRASNMDGDFKDASHPQLSKHGPEFLHRGSSADPHPSPKCCYDEYSMDVSGLSLKRRQASQDRNKVWRDLMPATSAAVLLCVCHWSRVKLPQAMIHVDTASMELGLQAADVEAILVTLSELIWVGMNLASSQVAAPRVQPKEHYRNGGCPQRALRDPLPPPRSNPQGMRSNLDVEGSKLWEIVVEVGRMIIDLRLPGPSGQEEQLELSMVGQELRIYSCLDGSTGCIYCVKDIELGGGEAPKFYRGPQSLRHLDQVVGQTATRFIPDHWNLRWMLRPPLAPASDWSFNAVLSVDQPTVLVWLPSAVGLLNAANHCAKMVASWHPSTWEAEFEGDTEVFSIERRKSFAKLSVLLPDCMGFVLRVSRAQILIPVEGSSSCSAKDTNSASGCSTPSCAASSTFAQSPPRPCLRVQLSSRIDLNDCVFISNVDLSTCDVRLDIKASMNGLAADFVMPPRALAKAFWDPWAWAVGQINSLTALSPCCLSTKCSVKEGGRVKLELNSWPVTMFVFPATRVLMMELGTSIMAVMTKCVAQRIAKKTEMPEAVDHALTCIPAHDITAECSVNLSSPRERFMSSATSSDLTDSCSCWATGDLHMLEPSRKQPNRLPRPKLSLPLTPTIERVCDSCAEERSAVPKPQRMTFASDSDGGPEQTDDLNGKKDWTLSDELHMILSYLVKVAYDVALHVSLDFAVHSEALVVRAGEIPGGAQPLHAEVVLEDLSLCLRHTDGYAENTDEWITIFWATVRADALDALSLHVEPVLEPVRFNLHLESRRRGHRQFVPSGQLSISWANVNVPIGTIYAARLWLRAEDLYSRATTASSGDVDFAGSEPDRPDGQLSSRSGCSTPLAPDKPEHQLPSRPVSSTHSVPELMYVPEHTAVPNTTSRDVAITTELGRSGLVSTTGRSHGKRLQEVIESLIVNVLGQPIAVKLLDGGTQQVGSRWCIVGSDRPRANAQVAQTSEAGAAVVPRLAIRLVWRGHKFEIKLGTQLQVPQFEVVQLKLPRRDALLTCRRLSLILRAVPSNGSQGCALMISSAAFVRNTTNLSLMWSVPQPQASMDSDLTGLWRFDSTTSMHSWVPQKSSVLSHKKGSSGDNSTSEIKQIRTPRCPAVTWRHSSEEVPLPADVEGGIALLGREVRTSAGSVADSLPAEEEDKEVGGWGQEYHTRDVELVHQHRMPLPLCWLAAAAVPSRAPQLCLGLAGTDFRSQVLPAETLCQMGSFDFSQPHREEEKRLSLSGSLIKLWDANGTPVHLCCTVIVGLLADRAMVLEVVVASIFITVNHLPFNLCMQASCQGISRPKQQICIGTSAKEYIAANEIDIDLEMPQGLFLAHVQVKADTFFTEGGEQQVHAFPPSPNAAKFSKARGVSRSNSLLDITGISGSQAMRGSRKLQEQGVSIAVLSSSAFDLDPPLLQLDSAESWLETLSWFHPVEWPTYRRAITIYTKCMIENKSSTDVYFRAAGARGVKASSAELLVPMGDCRLLPANLVNTGKMRVGIQARRPRKETGGFRWESRRASIKNLCCGEKDAKVFLGIVVDRAPMPFSKMQVIQLYDSVTLVNNTSLMLACWVPRSFGIHTIQNGLSGGRSSVMLRWTQKAIKFDEKRYCIPGSSADVNTVRIDSDTTMLRIAVFDKTAVSNMESEAEEGGSEEQGGSSLAGRLVLPVTNVNQANKDVVRVLAKPADGEQSQVLRHLDVALDKATSFQVRYPTRLVSGWREYNNFRVIVEKKHQGVATTVTLEPAEPRFVIWNESPLRVLISQAGISSEREVVEPNWKIPFVWYDPNGSLQLDANPYMEDGDSTPGYAVAVPFGTSMSWMGRSNSSIFSADSKLQITREFDAPLGYELVRIRLKARQLARAKSWLGQRTGLPAANIRSFLNREDSTQISEAGLGGMCSARYGVTLNIQGVGVSLMDASPLQIMYVALDTLTVRVGPSERVRQNLCDKTKLGKTTSLVTRFAQMLRYLPAIDVSITLLNLQVDSHIPGSFFPCVLRPLQSRSQLWRALDHYHHRRHTRANACIKPVLTISIDGCQLMGRDMGGGAVVLNCCKACLEPLVVNIDEAFVVGLVAYYCRVAVYFNLPPFQESRQALETTPSHASNLSLNKFSHEHDLSGLKKLHRTMHGHHRWLLTVEDAIEIKEMDTYFSMRLMESASPYVEELQRDEHVGVLLGMLIPLFAAALFQPAMLSTHSRTLLQKRVCMSPKELFKLVHEHFVAPVEKRIGFSLLISVDWLGNPRLLVSGILAGFRELLLQPYKHGLVGLPLGIVICLCSVFGSIFDSLARVINSVGFKPISRVQRTMHNYLGVQSLKRSTAILALSTMPIDGADGLTRGTNLMLLQCRTVFLNVRQIVKLLHERSQRRKSRAFCYFVILIIAMAATLVLGIVEALLLFVYNILQGLVSSLYRRSAEAVGDYHPMQLFVLELPVHVRPLRYLQGAMGESGDGQTNTTCPFAFLPSLARTHLHPEDGLLPPWQWQERVDESDEIVHLAVPCGGSSMPDGVTMILCETLADVALLHVSEWAGLSASGRPKRPKAKYKWLWKAKRSDIINLSLAKHGTDWLLSVECGTSVERWDNAFLWTSSIRRIGSLVVQAGSRHSLLSVPFALKHHAFRALEMLAPLAHAGSIAVV